MLNHSIAASPSFLSTIVSELSCLILLRIVPSWVYLLSTLPFAVNMFSKYSQLFLSIKMSLYSDNERLFKIVLTEEDFLFPHQDFF